MSIPIDVNLDLYKSNDFVNKESLLAQDSSRAE